MLAYYLTWHLKAAWKPLLFTDERRPVSPDPVAKAVRSPAAQQKAQRNGPPPGSPRTATARSSPSSQRKPGTPPACTATPATFEKLTQPTPLQAEALELAEHAPVVAAR